MKESSQKLYVFEEAGKDPTEYYHIGSIKGADGNDFMKLVNGLAEENIEARPMWKPMHLQPVFSQCDYVTEKDGLSISDKIFENGICLPSDIKNTDEDMDRIIECVKRLIK